MDNGQVEEAGRPSVEPSRAVAPRGEKISSRDLKIGTSGVAFGNAGEMIAFANLMQTAGEAVPAPFRNNAGACLAVISDSVAFGIHPFALARMAYFVSGNLAYMAQAISAIITARAPIKRRPKYEWTGEAGEMVCTVTVETTDGEVITHVSPKKKEITTQNSPLWKSDPRQQLGYYTVRSMARLHFPDVLMGIYDVDEAASFRREVEEKRSSIAERLPGSGPVIDGAHIDREVKGEEEARPGPEPTTVTIHEAEDRIEEAEVVEEWNGGLAGVPGTEHGLMAQIRDALDNAVTKNEIEAAYSEFEGAVEAASEAGQAFAGKLLEERRAAYTNSLPAAIEAKKGGKAAKLL